jgi:hypothetical protein
MNRLRNINSKRLGEILFLAGFFFLFSMFAYLAFLEVKRPIAIDAINGFSLKFKALTKNVFVSEVDRLIVSVLGLFSICIVGCAIWLLQKEK